MGRPACSATTSISGEKGASGLRNWIRQAVASNLPYDKFAYAVLTASGSNLENPPASYYKILREPGPLMENNTQLFLGVRFNCNNCHDHPFERWTQSQHWQLAAFFANVARKDDPTLRRTEDRRHRRREGQALGEIIYDGTTAGEVRNPTTQALQTPDFPYHVSRHGLAARHAPRAIRPLDRLAQESVFRQELCQSAVELSDWASGFIEPIDDIRAGNPPTNPELLDRMTAEFVASGFDVQAHAAADLQVGHLSAFARHQQVEQTTTRSTIPTPSPAACRPKCSTTRCSK